MSSVGPSMLPNLPVELFIEIYNNLEPRWHFSLAIACKQIYSLSNPVLDAHRNAHRKCRVVSDCSLTLIVRLYHSARASIGLKAIEAWHVRKVEIWGMRATWKQWKNWYINPAGHICVALNEKNVLPPIDASELMESFQDSSSVEDISLRHALPGEHEDIKSAFNVGNDGCFKALVISLLPRLNELIFLEKAPEELSTLKWLDKMIYWSKFGQNPWPPGFLSLRKVAVGIPVNKREVNAKTPSKLLCALLELPCIEQIYCRKLDLGTVPPCQFRLSHETRSSLKTLILDEIVEADDVLRIALIEATTNLETLIVRGGDRGVVQAVDDFPEAFRLSSSRFSVRNLLFYRPDRMMSYFCTTYQPGQLLPMQNLRMIHLCVDDFFMECYKRHSGGLVRKPRKGNQFPGLGYERIAEISSNHEGDVTDDASTEEFECECGDKCDKNAPIKHSYAVAYFQRCLPRKLEVLILWGHEEEIWFGREEHEENETLDDAIVAVIYSGLFPNLKAIYLDRVERHEPILKIKTKVCFQKTMAAGKERGIYVRTLSNQHEPIPQLDFPCIPDKFDIETAPFPARDPTLIIDPFTGFWEPPGCRSCGNCETCLLYYTREAWAEFKGQN